MAKLGSSELDPAIIEGIQIDPAVTEVRSSSASSKISTTTNGRSWHYFLKTSSNGYEENTFEGTKLT